MVAVVITITFQPWRRYADCRKSAFDLDIEIQTVFSLATVLFGRKFQIGIAEPQ